MCEPAITGSCSGLGYLWLGTNTVHAAVPTPPAAGVHHFLLHLWGEAASHDTHGQLDALK
jgi:hypothetical protein